MKIAIAQINPTIGDIAGNAKQILEAAQQAAKQDVRLLLTPELSLCGYPPRDLLLYPGFVESMWKQIESIALQLPPILAVLIGIVDINSQAAARGEKPLYNSMVWLEGGKVQKIFHKRLLPTYDVFDEDRYFEPGRDTNTFTLSIERSGISGQPQGIAPTDNLNTRDLHDKKNSISIGVTICEDLWNDEKFWGKRSYEIDPIEDLANLNVDIIINLSASPYSFKKQQLREAMLSHAANRFSIPIAYVNQVGGNDDLIFDGNSIVFNRQGEAICRAKAFDRDLVIIEFNEDKKDLTSPLSHSDSIPIPDSRLPTPKAKRPHLSFNSDEEEIFSALVLGVKDYAKKCGFSKAILGLSGGIDSSLVAAIAVAAVGKENVLGVLMPSPYSSKHSISDAEALVNNLGINSHQLPIGEAMSVYDKILEPLFTGTSFGIAEENLQSRIRGNLLMAIANKFGYLLLSTGNKSEMAVGYCTLYGDMNGGLAVIADVPKTLVFSICRWLNRDNEVIPHNVITKPPSAELKPGQLDRDSLPDYEILDDILDRLIHQHQSESQIVASGHDLEIVQKVMKLVSRAEFKRKQAPPGLKITDRAFGTGWRMPIASRWLT
jgi:NAD+ synthase (glutamine-hydrolysing)